MCKSCWLCCCCLMTRGECCCCFTLCSLCVCLYVVAVLNVAATALSVSLLWFCAAFFLLFFSSFDDVDYFNSAKVKAQPTTVTPGPEFLFYRVFGFFFFFLLAEAEVACDWEATVSQFHFISFLIHSHFTSFHCKIVRRSHQPSAIVSSSFILINIVAVTSLLCLFVWTLFVLCLLMVGFFSTINNRRRRSAEKSIFVVFVFDFSYMCEKNIFFLKSDLIRNLHIFFFFLNK